MSSLVSRARRLQLSNGADATGTQLFDLSIMIVAISALGLSAGQLGLLNALGTVSFLLLSVPLGVLVDRLGPWRVLMVSLTLKTLIVLVGTTLYFTGRLNTITVMVLVTVMGVVVVSTENSQTSIVPLVMGGNDDPASIVSLMASADHIAQIAAPAVVGFMIAHGHAKIAFSLAVAMLLLAAATAILLRPTRTGSVKSNEAGAGAATEADKNRDTACPTEDPKAKTSKLKSLRSEWTHGFRIILRNRVLLAVIMLVTAGNMGIAIGDSTISIVILRELHLGAAFYGTLGTIAAISGLIGATIAPRIIKSKSLWNIFAVTATVQFFLALMPLTSLLIPTVARPLFILHDALWGISMTLSNISSSAYRVSVVDSDSLGRASAASRMITMGSVPIAAILGGVLADLAGLKAPLILWPTILGVATVIFFIFTRKNKTQPTGKNES